MWKELWLISCVMVVYPEVTLAFEGEGHATVLGEGMQHLTIGGTHKALNEKGNLLSLTSPIHAHGRESRSRSTPRWSGRRQSPSHSRG
jgi:hypothetical protein